MRAELNELLTRIDPGSVMGGMLRQYWTPAVRSASLERDGAPVRVRLFGEDFVAFRVTDGRVGFIEEACPHRAVSLALARNEDNGLRCIFHGLKIDVTGKVVDAPCEPPEQRVAYCARVRTGRYTVREVAGIVWVFLGKGEAPPFPEFEFNNLPPENVYIRRAVVPYNWMQTIESHIDSAHVPILHSGFLGKGDTRIDPLTRHNLLQMTADIAPKFEIVDTAYGLQEAAIRNTPDGGKYARVREVVLPWYMFIPGPPDAHCDGRITVPIDDETSADWYVLYNPHGPLTQDLIDSKFQNVASDPDNFAANIGTAENLWGQDRAAMNTGHFSGLTKNLFFEDFIVQASIGRRSSRANENLGVADTIVVTVRRKLIEAARAFEAGSEAPWLRGFDYRSIRSESINYVPPRTWQEAMPLREAPAKV